MKLSRKNWNNYVAKLSAINKTAGRKMQEWIDKHGTDDVEELVSVAYALTSKYGEAASATACQMYDEIAAMQKAHVPPAEPKAPQHINYVDRAVRDTILRSPSTVPGTVSEMVKRTGAETTLKNAKRDGAYFAWVPNGDTCAFCITLASNGWRRASRKTINGDHAEHIHKNCDCEFAISFNGPGSIEGYDPDRYLAMYEGAEGTSWKDKVNSMRRAHYAANKDAINAQKRAAYAKRRVQVLEKERLLTSYSNRVNMDVLDAPGYVDKFKGITGVEDVDDVIYKSAKEIFQHRNGTDFEDLYLIDAKTGAVIHKLTTCDIENGVDYDTETLEAIEKAKREKRTIIALHNHPGGLPPSLDDGVSAHDHGYVKGVAVGHNLEVYTYSATDQHYSKKQCEALHDAISDAVKYSVDFDDSV